MLRAITLNPASKTRPEYDLTKRIESPSANLLRKGSIELIEVRKQKGISSNLVQWVQTHAKMPVELLRKKLLEKYCAQPPDY
jgi:hypothetical protein